MSGLPSVLMFLLALAGIAALPAQATNRDDSRHAAGDQSMEPVAVNTIRVASEAAGHVSINLVVLTSPGNTVAAPTEGSVTRNLVRSRLPTFVPLLGGLFEKPPILRDYTDANFVGEALLAGRTLIVRLAAPLASPGAPGTVFVANGQHAFAMAGANFKESPLPDLAGALAIGRAHAEGGELVILVAPSILE